MSTKIEEYKCTCKKCVSMCENRPCWGTPKEAQAIIDAGLGDKLMIDYWCGDANTNYEDVRMAQPAIVGYEGRMAPFSPYGKCAFLENGLCTLHDKGLKPIEGRAAICNPLDEEVYINNMKQLRKDIVTEWNTPEGRSIVEKI